MWKENTTLRFLSEGTLGSKIADVAEAATIEVRAKRLKDLLSEKIDLLKLDIEGAEYEVIRDCADVLHMADHLFIEFHGHFTKMNELTEILEIVRKNNFAFYIKEATSVYPTPFFRTGIKTQYDIQLNIFCFKE